MTDRDGLIFFLKKKRLRWYLLPERGESKMVFSSGRSREQGGIFFLKKQRARWLLFLLEESESKMASSSS